MEMWYAKIVSDYDMLRIFNCPAYYDLNDGKLKLRLRKKLFLKFKRGVKGYKLYNSKYRKIIH